MGIRVPTRWFHSAVVRIKGNEGCERALTNVSIRQIYGGHITAFMIKGMRDALDGLNHSIRQSQAGRPQAAGGPALSGRPSPLHARHSGIKPWATHPGGQRAWDPGSSVHPAGAGPVEIQLLLFKEKVREKDGRSPVPQQRQSLGLTLPKASPAPAQGPGDQRDADTTNPHPEEVKGSLQQQGVSWASNWFRST